MRPGLILASLMSAAVLTGCAGFQPLYGDSAANSQLSAVDVRVPEGRTGYLMRQHLDDVFAKKRGAPAAYVMDVAVAETRYPLGVRIDNVATRYEYVLTATYVLKAQKDGRVAKRGNVRVSLTYDAADQPYASIAAQQDAQDRAAGEAARRIQLELSVWLANGAKG